MGRVIERDIISPCVEVFGQRQKTRVFARAVVVDAARRVMGADHGVTHACVARNLRPADQIIDATSDMIQPCADIFRMDRTAPVGCTGQRQLFGRQRVCGGRPTFDQGQGL